MPDTPPIPDAAWVVFALFVSASIYIYARAVQNIAREGGRVQSKDFALPELLMSLVFAGFFAMLMVNALQRPEEADRGKIAIDVVLPSSLLFVAFTVGILGFLRYGRRLPLGPLFGLDRLAPLAAIGWAVGLVLAAFPLCGAANVVSAQVLQDHFAPQPLVKLFSEVARSQDFLAIGKIFVSGVIIQPACEEFLFRGFFYAVWKHYLPPIGAGFLACLLFAAFHTSLPAFGGLFILAVCLNLAYERTGSILVPIGMHAIFNFTSLLVLYVQARFGPPL